MGNQDHRIKKLKSITNCHENYYFLILEAHVMKFKNEAGAFLKSKNSLSGLIGAGAKKIIK